MKNNLAKIKSLVRSSNLSFQEIDDLVEFLSQIDEKSMVTLIELFEKNPSWILIFYQNIQAKKSALNTKDKKTWNKIVEKERLDLLKMEMEDIKK